MADKLTQIKDHLSDFVSKEAELAKAEIVPSAKKAGKGTVLMIVAFVFVLHAVWMFVIGLAAVFAWLVSFTGASTALSIVLGFLIATVVSMVIAGFFAFLGWRSFKKVKAPKATIAEAKATLDAITESIAGRNHGALPENAPGLTVIDESGSRLGTDPAQPKSA